MSKKKPAVLITLDSMKNPNTGLFYFGKSLGKALFNLQKTKPTLDLTFYVSEHDTNIFEGEAVTIKHSKFHNFFFSKSKDFKLIHFTDQICRLRPFNVKGKKVLTIHDLNPLHEKNELNSRDKKNFSRLAQYIDECDQIVAISNFVAEDIKRIYPQTKNKIKVIYNGADNLPLKPGFSPRYIPQSQFIFSIGEILPKKNFHVLPSLLQRNDFELVIAGKPTSMQYLDEIHRIAQAMNVTPRVKILGAIDENEKAWYFKNCLAFAFPSLAEGFGLPVIEAMHFEKPVFLSNLTSLPEIGGIDSFYFKSFEPRHMQDVFEKGILTFENDISIKNRLKERALTFTWERAAEQYINLYQEMLHM